MRVVARSFIRLRTILWELEDGANLLEYAILLAFIVIVAIVGVQLVGQETTENIEPVTTVL